MTTDDHLPAEGQTCQTCGEDGHLECGDLGLTPGVELIAAGELVRLRAIEAAAIAVTEDWAQQIVADGLDVDLLHALAAVCPVIHRDRLWGCGPGRGFAVMCYCEEVRGAEKAHSFGTYQEARDWYTQHVGERA